MRMKMLRKLCLFCMLSAVCLSQDLQKAPEGTSETQRDTVLRQSSTTAIRHGAGDWRKIPSDLRAQKDDVSPQLRALRNRYWSQHPMASDSNPLSWQLSPDQSDDPKSQAGLIAVQARVTEQRVFPVGPESAYTEVKLEVTATIGESLDVSIGQTLNLMMPGGTYIDANGIKHSASLQLEKHPVQPGHEYLLLLKEESPEAFVALRKWEIVDGIAIPSGEREIIAFRSGNSLISGQPVQAARLALAALVAKDKEGK